MHVAKSFGSQQRCATVWLNFSNTNSKHVPWSLADAQKAGRRDMVFRCCYFSGTCWTRVSISSSGTIGFANFTNILAFSRPKEK